MNLKNFQREALIRLEYWLEQLNQHSKKSELNAVPKLSWDDIYERYRDTNKYHRSRIQEDRKEIPNACIKIPTGGGKTFVAAESLERIMRLWVGSQTGLVIWLVPSNSIYNQTLNLFRKKGEYIRQSLNQKSGGRLKVFTREDNFTKNDIENYLCIMVLTSQSFVESDTESESQSRLTINRPGDYSEFFPDSGNKLANKKLLEKYKGLDEIGDVPIPSLKNTIRINNPVVIIDEAHRFTGKNNLTTVKEMPKLNPTIILEFSATPRQESNILYEASGESVWKEDMIKLPIQLYHKNTKHWQTTLQDSVNKRNYLEEIAKEELTNGGSYVRPIMVIRANHTGKATIGKSIHANEVKEYLKIKLKVPEEYIAIHASELKELVGVDLLSNTCQIRYIITKDALKEGWDCPYAYVLAILENFRAETGITQLLGRVMRQPYARKFKNSELNYPYVFCCTDDTNMALDGAKRGLEKEGYNDIKDLVDLAGGGFGKEYSSFYKKTFLRKELQDCKIYFPKVKIYENGKPREFNYDADLLSRIDWDNISYDNSFTMGLGEVEEDYQVIGFQGNVISRKKRKLKAHHELDIVYLSERLLDKVPNIFVAARIINNAINYYKTKYSEQKVLAQVTDLIEEIKNRVSKDIEKEAKHMFDNMMRKNIISVKFANSKINEVDWSLPKFDFYNSNEDIRDQEKYAYEKINSSSMNELEKEAAADFERSDIIDWWFRTTARGLDNGYFIQGWRRDRVYPDFLLATAVNSRGIKRCIVIETKGTHLEGNDDTLYKRELLNLIEDRMNEKNSTKTHYFFKVINEGNWKSEFNSLLSE